ncbi:MAG: ankyrin repeat domain-containing protein [Planctomycetota bacterium]
MGEDFEAKLAKMPVAERRGVWTTWGADTWEAVLIRGGFDATLDRLAAAEGVGGVERGLAEAVLAGTRPAPDGSWLLLVELDDGTDWLHVAHGMRYFDQYEQLATWTDGPVMRVGYQDTAGATHVTVTEAADTTLSFESTGMHALGDGGDEPEEEEFEDFEVPLRFETEMLPADWPRQFESEDEVQQALMRELDAYVPMIGAYAEEGMVKVWAGHDDVLDAKHVKNIALVLLGEKRSATPNQANRQMAEAIKDGDVEGVRAALEAGASLTQLPDNKRSPLGFAVSAYRLEPEARLEIVAALLAAGADPDHGGANADPPLLIAIDKANHEPGLAVRLSEALLDAGATMTVIGRDLMAKGQTPLEKAAQSGQLAMVQFLHARGADPLSKNAKGQTAREAVARSIELVLEHMGEDAEEHVGGQRAVLAYLESAEAGGPPGEDWRSLLDAAQKQAIRKQREMKQSFAKLGDAFKQLGALMDAEDGEDVEAALAAAAASQPTIELEPDDDKWQNEKRREQLASALEEQGFARIGPFKTTGGMNVKVLAYVHEADRLYATIYEQPDGTSWCDVVRLHADDSVLTATNTKSPPAYDLPRFRKIREPKWGLNKLVAAVRAEPTPDGGAKAVNAGRFVEDVKWVIAEEQAELRRTTE